MNSSFQISKLNRVVTEKLIGCFGIVPTGTLFGYTTAGITTNINFLKYILRTNEFSQGKYDINFIDNINFAEKFKNELKKTNEEMEVAASVFAGLLKSKRKNKFKVKSSTDTNEWWGQNYE